VLEVIIKKKLPDFYLNVSFSVNREIISILGPSGSGKTLTLQCIAGLVNPDEGYIKLNDRVLFNSEAGINLPPQVRKVGFVFQNYALFQHLTVNQNIAYGISNRTGQEIQERVSNLLQKMNITKLGKRYPAQLSAGQQQRVAIARALAPEPEILLLDEPFSALDSLVKERLQLELQSLHNFYRGNILFVTHDLAEGYRLGSKIAVYETGRIAQYDDKEKVVAFPSNHTVARLVGYKNLLKGRIIDVKGSSIWIKVPELAGNLKAKVNNKPNIMTDQNVTIGVRPEYITFTDHPGENIFSGVIDRIVQGIAATTCYCHITGVSDPQHYIMVILPWADTKNIQERHECYIYLPPEHVVILQD
jgi:molybdate transport system ATP-binding protein